jgi:hypothetical protein
MASRAPRWRAPPNAPREMGSRRAEPAANLRGFQCHRGRNPRHHHSTDTGRIEVSWRVDGDAFAMSWTESGGPSVRPPERQGFGTTVIDTMVKRTLGGEVQLDYAPSGLAWRLTCPAGEALGDR